MIKINVETIKEFVRNNKGLTISLASLSGVVVICTGIMVGTSASIKHKEEQAIEAQLEQEALDKEKELADAKKKAEDDERKKAEEESIKAEKESIEAEEEKKIEEESIKIAEEESIEALEKLEEGKEIKKDVDAWKDENNLDEKEFNEVISEYIPSINYDHPIIQKMPEYKILKGNDFIIKYTPSVVNEGYRISVYDDNGNCIYIHSIIYYYSMQEYNKNKEVYEDIFKETKASHSYVNYNSGMLIYFDGSNEMFKKYFDETSLSMDNYCRWDLVIYTEVDMNYQELLDNPEKIMELTK